MRLSRNAIPEYDFGVAARAIPHSAELSPAAA
jgi:hypothetical protein